MATSIGFPKGKTRRQIKARKDRSEAAVIKKVRAEAEARDGFCIWMWSNEGPCEGVSEMAHLDDYRRFQTRGQAPELRHQLQFVAMMCSRHHRLFDARKLPTEPIVGAPSAGAAVGEGAPEPGKLEGSGSGPRSLPRSFRR